MKVREAMTRDPVACESTVSLQRVAMAMLDHDCAAVPITRSNRVIGIVTDRDIACRGVARGWNAAELPATAVMSSPLVAVGPDDDFDDAVQLMEENHVHHLPVIDARGHLLGIVAQSDLGRRMSNRELGRLARETSIRQQHADTSAALLRSHH
jgi:CBS domain-containing protein